MNLVSKTEGEQRKILLGMVAAAMSDLNFTQTDIENVVFEIEYKFKTTEDVEALQLYRKFIKKYQFTQIILFAASRISVSAVEKFVQMIQKRASRAATPESPRTY